MFYRKGILTLLNSENSFLPVNILKALLLSKKECLPPNKKGSIHLSHIKLLIYD